MVSYLCECIFSRHSEVKNTNGTKNIEMFKQWFRCRGRSFHIFNKLMGYIYFSYKCIYSIRLTVIFLKWTNLKVLCFEVKDM